MPDEPFSWTLLVWKPIYFSSGWFPFILLTLSSFNFSLLLSPLTLAIWLLDQNTLFDSLFGLSDLLPKRFHQLCFSNLPFLSLFLICYVI